MSTGNIVLLHAGWLWCITVLPVLLLIYHKIRAKLGVTDFPGKDGFMGSISSQNDRLYHPLIHLIPLTPTNRKTVWWQSFFLILVFSSFIFSLSQPVRLGKPLTKPPHERDIVFIVDTSLSMILRDYVYKGKRVERINVLKDLLKNFVTKLNGERIAIIVFGDTAQTLVPLTRDNSLLTGMIDRISAGMLKRHNAMGDAITLAVHEALQEKQRQRILVLFTDAGDDTGKVTPSAAAQLASEANLPLYTIAIGSNTAKAEEQQRRAGLIFQTVDEKLLTSIAQKTGAKSYQAGDINTLQQAITEITRYKQQRAMTIILYQQQPLYIWPMLLGIILILLAQSVYLYRSFRQ